jgi:hypothetical protein
LHEERYSGLVVEKAGFEKGEPGKHTENKYGGKHDPSFIAVVQVLAAEVLEEGCKKTPNHNP